VGNQRDALEVLEMAGRGIVKTHVRIMKMEELTEVFNEMSQGKSKYILENPDFIISCAFSCACLQDL
jgi:D-arabinose 1-dehydrogenase-like Zn-dependent alcohol dehydrogenase